MKIENEEPIKIYSTLEEFELNIPYTVEILKTPQQDKVYLIGTAHFSKKSQTDVSLVMRNVKPNGLVLELCPLRLHILQLDEATLLREAQDLNPNKIREMFKEHGATNGLFYLSFLKTNANITKKLGVAPGGECRRAVKEAKQLPDCKIFLGDRPLNITIQRALAGLTLKEKMMISMAMHSENTHHDITEDDVEKFKQRDAEPLDQMKQHTPTIYAAFVSERDYMLAHSMSIAIERCRQENNRSTSIVGVIGMGHMKGIIENFGKTDPKVIKELLKLPKTNGNGGGSGSGFRNTTTSLLTTQNSNFNNNLKYLFDLGKLWKKFKK